MSAIASVGKILLFCAIALAIAGLLLLFGHKIPFLGRLPGDILVQKENFRFFLPLATCLLISAGGTIILNLVLRLFGK